MGCPYLEEVVMVFCSAYPVKKLVPRNRMAATGPCQGEAFMLCPLYREVLARRSAARGCGEEARALAANGKEATK